MGGAKFFYRVTLIVGKGEGGFYGLETHPMSIGEKTPNSIPYSDMKILSYDQLVNGLFGYNRDETRQITASLSQANPSMELHYTRHFTA